MIKSIPFYTDLLQEGGNTTHILLYGLINLLSYEKGYCWASNETLAKELGLSKSRVASAISEMSKMGWIKVKIDDKNHRIGIYPMWHLSKNPSQKQQPPLTELGNQSLPEMATNYTSKTIPVDSSIPYGIEGENSEIEGKLVNEKLPAKAEYGNSEINGLFKSWSETCGFEIKSKVQLNRFACQRLIKSRGVQAIENVLKVLPETFTDQYAPTVKNFMDLEEKWDNLRIWYGKRYAKTQSRKEIKDGVEYTYDSSGNIVGVKL